MKKLAFLFLTYDNLRSKKIWKSFFEQADPNLYSIYIHPKNPKKVNGFQQYIIDDLCKTKWGHISIVRAELNLFKACYKDPLNEKAILCSDSCLPLYNFETIYNILMKEPKKSYVTFVKPNILRKMRYLLLRHKNDLSLKTWSSYEHFAIVFQRALMKLFIENDLTKDFKRVFIPEEHYFTNVLSLLEKNPYECFENKKLTFMDFGRYYRSHPTTYESLSKKEIDKIKEKGFLFLRKVSKEIQLPENFW